MNEDIVKPFTKNYLFNLDWRDMMGKIPDETVDLVLTDPPYESMRRWEGVGTTARMGMGKKGTKADDATKFFQTIPNDDLPDLIQEIHRVLKFERHAYIMCDFETLKLLHYFAIEEGVFAPVGYGGKFEACKPLIWDKVAMGMGYTYRATYEFVLMLWKGKKRQLNDLGVSDILRFKRVAPSEAIVPTQKPVEMFELLIKQSTQEGELVCDPFMGSGTTMVAADRLKREWIGSEISEENWALAMSRFNNDKLVRGINQELGI